MAIAATASLPTCARDIRRMNRTHGVVALALTSAGPLSRAAEQLRRDYRAKCVYRPGSLLGLPHGRVWPLADVRRWAASNWYGAHGDDVAAVLPYVDEALSRLLDDPDNCLLLVPLPRANK
ncbi:hypothetical protein [Micromonospora endolithica]|uniref:hypothetical protein n=1 Tax=Micromonospora endolithica TaxID=230091 RepID=UPI0011AC9C3D|nr:hypothetical protein [Micromonospora endolithica]TWJ26157.1 hypothetical protein JD76_06337 [Micromonospora endolithica]